MKIMHGHCRKLGSIGKNRKQQEITHVPGTLVERLHLVNIYLFNTFYESSSVLDARAIKTFNIQMLM